jgi:serine/threonine-protein kinase
VFARIGARVVYGLGRQVTAAREFGSYHLEERLGAGGMGEVWRARHRLLARPAAIKLIHPALTASPEALRRFEREAQVIAGLRSPHTVTLFDFGVAEGGSFYYVMELLEGLDADRLVREFGPVPPERVIHILQQICHSLSEAEASGLVHRDIKPANIFLCRYGEDHDFVKVLDFGIVKALAEGTEASPESTRENVVPGSPAFIAPEQAMGERQIDGRADLYATGCVGYWLLTGRTVFVAATPLGLLMAHAGEPPTAPSTRTTRPIPPELDDLILRCLAKAPSSPPDSARVLARELAQVPGAGDWTEERAAAWWKQVATA